MITQGTDGMMEIAVKNLVPYFHVQISNKGGLIPVEVLTNLTYPLTSAVVFSGVHSNGTSFCTVSNLTLTDDGKSLTIKVQPLEFIST